MTNLNPRSLSVEEMLEHLRRQAQFARSVSRLNAFGSTMNLGPDEESPPLAERFLDRSAVNIREAEALETAAKVLEVLTHPDFYQLEDFGRPVEPLGCRAYVSFQRLTSKDKRGYEGETVLEAIMKAHKARFPEKYLEGEVNT